MACAFFFQVLCLRIQSWQTGLHQTQTLRKPRFPRNLRAILSWLKMSRSSASTRGSLLVIQPPFRLQLCLHKEEVAPPELQGAKGSETIVQLLVFCAQPCKEPWELPWKYLVPGLTSCSPLGTWGSAEMISYTCALWSVCLVNETGIQSLRFPPPNQNLWSGTWSDKWVSPGVLIPICITLITYGEI